MTNAAWKKFKVIDYISFVEIKKKIQKALLANSYSHYKINEMG